VGVSDALEMPHLYCICIDSKFHLRGFTIDLDEETSQMVSSALKQAKVDLVHKYASKQPADMMAENENESLPDRRESMDIRDFRRFMISPLKDIIKGNTASCICIVSVVLVDRFDLTRTNYIVFNQCQLIILFSVLL
jgi:hypothetical protein